MLSAQQVVSAYAEIEEMTRRDTWRIVVVVRCAICRNTHSQGAAMCVTASRDPLGRRRERVATKETNLRLLIGSEGQGCSKIWDRPRNQTTVISPGERGIWGQPLPVIELVLQLRGLLKLLIVIDSKHPGRQIGIEEETAAFWGEEARPRMARDYERREAFVVGYVRAEGQAVDL